MRRRREGSERYDLILDVASTLSLAACQRVLTPTGVLVVIGHDHYGGVGRRVLGSLPQMLGLVARAPFDRHVPGPDSSPFSKQEAMTHLKRLLETGKLTPDIDRTFPLDQVGEAMLRLQQGRALGRILLAP